MKGVKVCIISILFTLIYLVTSIALSNLLLFNNSNGSLIKLDKRIIGSKLIGQDFRRSIYFHGRPSLYNYKNDISGNSNFPFYSKELVNNTLNEYTSFTRTNQNAKPDLNLITESASGLDPHITYQGALCQVNRISKASGISEAKILELIQKKSKPRFLGLLGEKIVNVLELNLELSKLYAKTSKS